MDEVLKQLDAFYHDFPVVIGVTLVFSVLERFLPAGPQKSLKGWVLNFFQLGLLYVLVPIFLAGVIVAATLAVTNRLGLGWIDLRFPTSGVTGQILATLLWFFVFDFFYYWFHRFQHESKVLWQQHKLHHMDEEMGASTNNRAHWSEDLFRVPAIVIPMAVLFKVNPVAGGLIGYIFNSWDIFFHSNLKIHLGRGSVLFNGPQAHRIHHSRLPQHHDKNYAAFFPIWDVIFRTFYYPKPDEFPPTGVHDEREIATFREGLILPFREWWKMGRAWRGRRAATLA